jgi:quinoprotein glucose dehydrogenase
MPRTLTLFAFAFLLLSANVALPADGEAPYEPKVASASDEPKQALTRIKLPEGLTAETFAAEPLLANPVCFFFDDQGRCYVAETFRHHAGVTDNRQHMDWLDADLAARTVADRVAMYKKFLGDAFVSYETEHERVRLITDTDQDGFADHASVFADGFRDAADGIGAGLLARGQDVYFACIPSLWQLRDEDGDGRADERRTLHTGYGVHVAFLGHDLHGLKMGPDGRLYFSIGDRGLHVETEGRVLDYPDTGAVLRCWPDGSELEVFAYGLRNPQELAFDELGNLFTADNNSDSGDKARWVHVLEGSDSGWRMFYQYVTTPVLRGPWNAEKLWYPAPENTAAYVLPPTANLGDGPSGLAYCPSDACGETFRNRFFLADFRGVSFVSNIKSIRLEPKGASYVPVDATPIIRNVLPTDVDFGPDGAFYMSDWTEGWDKTGKGRIVRILDPTRNTAALARTQQLLREGFDHRSSDELITLLSEGDQRIRQAAQFALATRGAGSAKPLQELALSTNERLPRLHALWALGQLARQEPNVLAPLTPLLRDNDEELRGQAARLLGEHHHQPAFDDTLKLLADSNPRVRLLAATGLAHHRNVASVGPLLDLLRDNNDQDPHLRHAAVMALVTSAAPAELLAHADDPSSAVRMGVLLALRRHQDARIARFLNDAEPALVVEAARAIYDLPLDGAMPALADRIAAPNDNPALMRRVLAAQARQGTAEAASALAQFAASAAEITQRREALDILAHWQSPPSRDRVMGCWRPLGERDPALAAAAVEAVIDRLLVDSDLELRQLATELAGNLKLGPAAPALRQIVVNAEQPAPLRVTALLALARLNDAELPAAVTAALASTERSLYLAGLQVQAQSEPAAAVAGLARLLDECAVAEQQQCVTVLAGIQDAAADDLLATWLTRLVEGTAPAELHLDLLTAAADRPNPKIRELVARHDAGRASDDPLSRFRETLAGGNAQRGEAIFREKTAVACLRCHKVKGHGGEVGPDLSDIGKRQQREYLLEAIVAPSKQLAKGFESVVVALSDGRVFNGVLRGETDDSLELITTEGVRHRIAKADIDERSTGISAMPEKLTDQLTKSELRDLIEFLAALK